LNEIFRSSAGNAKSKELKKTKCFSLQLVE